MSSIDRSAERSSDPELTALVAAEMATLQANRQREDRERTMARRATLMMPFAHHWPDDYEQRCFHIGPVPFCRRCSALYPLGFAVAFAGAFGYRLWPQSIDPWAIWLLCLPATVAFVGEMLGWFRYHPWWQMGTTLIAALAFGTALSYELNDRWSAEFWGPIAVFGGLWFFAGWLRYRRDT